MNNGRLLALFLVAATVALIVIGTIWPVKAAKAYTNGEHLVPSSYTPQAAVTNLGNDIRAQDWGRAYDSLANKAQFTQFEFMHDLTGYYPNLRTYSKLASLEAQPLHASDNEAEFLMRFHWATVVGDAVTKRDVRVVRNGDRWQVDWPIVKEKVVPPQVVSVNYLRWDVIYRGSGDDWGAQDVEAPHVKIVDMRPMQRAKGTVIMGELLNEDVVPAYVSVTATLLNKAQKPIGTQGSFDKISHLLLPKAVTPFLIEFPNVQLSQVGAVDMHPFSNLVPASADPVIELQNVKMNPAPDASVTGDLVNTSGEIANVAHVLSTFYDKSGNVVWVADSYVENALLPQTPIPFTVHIPEDLARRISTQHTIVSTFKFGGEA